MQEDLVLGLVMGSEQEEWFQDEVLEYQPVVDLEQDWDQVALDQV